MSMAMESSRVTLGILAGGRGSRLAGIDKAWLERNGVPQVLRWQQRFANEVDTTLVSANRNLARYATAGMRAVPDRITDGGPLSGLDALAHTCATPWLLTLPVDLVDVNDCLLQTLQAMAAAHGAFAEDDDGVQPLVALWDVPALRDAAQHRLKAGDFAIHRLQARLAMAKACFAGVRFGNINTPEDLLRAGVLERE